MFQLWRRSKILRTRDVAETLVEASVADQLAGYGSSYGEVLLRLYDEVQKARAAVEEQQVNAYANESEIRLLRRELQQLHEVPHAGIEAPPPRAAFAGDTPARVIGATALLFALLALLLALFA
jgi:hypothetical protein